MFNWRYWLPFKKNQINNSPEYIKRKNTYKIILEALKKTYREETPETQKTIEEFSKKIRNSYPELNLELPVN